MAVSRSFQDYVLDQLADLPQLRSQRLFSGVSLYSRDVIFALIFKDRLYFKTDEVSRADYVARGMEGFRTRTDKPDLKMSYYTVPADVLEDPEVLTHWARVALRASATPAARA